MADDAAKVVGDFEAQSWPLDAAAQGLAEVVDGFATGDTRPLVIGDRDRPVLVVLAVADLADFRARLTQMLADPVQAGWLRYYLTTTFPELGPERLSELLGLDADHGLTSLCSQVSVAQAATLLPDQVRRAEEGANPLMLIGDGELAAAALVSFDAFAVLLHLTGPADDEDEHSRPDPLPAALETLAARLGPVSTQLVAQITADRSETEVVYDLRFDDDLVTHLRDLEQQAQEVPAGAARDELRDLLSSLDDLRSGRLLPDPVHLGDGRHPDGEAPYVEAADLSDLLPDLRESFRLGQDEPYLVGIDGTALAGLVTYDLYEMLQETSVRLGGLPEAPVLPLPDGYDLDGDDLDGDDEGDEIRPAIVSLDTARLLAHSVVEEIETGRRALMFVGDEDGDAELVLAPLDWLWAYVEHLDLAEAALRGPVEIPPAAPEAPVDAPVDMAPVDAPVEMAPVEAPVDTAAEEPSP